MRRVLIIAGPCAGGAVYSPALTDFVIATRQASHMFVTGPDVVRASTGEQISDEELGGADIHGSVSGVVHYVAEDESDALAQVRTVLAYLPSSSDLEAPRYEYEDVDRAEAAYTARIAEVKSRITPPPSRPCPVMTRTARIPRAWHEVRKPRN